MTAEAGLFARLLLVLLEECNPDPPQQSCGSPLLVQVVVEGEEHMAVVRRCGEGRPVSIQEAGCIRQALCVLGDDVRRQRGVTERRRATTRIATCTTASFQTWQEVLKRQAQREKNGRVRGVESDHDVEVESGHRLRGERQHPRQVLAAALWVHVTRST